MFRSQWCSRHQKSRCRMCPRPLRPSLDRLLLNWRATGGPSRWWGRGRLRRSRSCCCWSKWCRGGAQSAKDKRGGGVRTPLAWGDELSWRVGHMIGLRVMTSKTLLNASAPAVIVAISIFRGCTCLILWLMWNSNEISVCETCWLPCFS